MDFELSTGSTSGGSGPDAFTAGLQISDRFTSVRIQARGETRDAARKSLQALLRAVAVEIQNAIEDLR